MATTNTTNDGAKNAWDEKELGCLWRREKQSTKEKYLTGVIKADKLREYLSKSNEDIQLVCFSNKGKSKDTHPDLRIYISEKRPASNSSAPAATSRPASRPAPAAAVRQAPASTVSLPDANDLI